LHVTPEATAAFRQQSAQDLCGFLECRARELVPGGKLLVATPGDSTESRLCDGVYDLLNDACLDLVTVGRIPRERYECLTVPVYFRTETEMRAPLEDAASALKDAFALDRAETLEVKAPFFKAFEETGDTAALATAYAGFLRAVSEPVVVATLAGLENAAAVVEALYERVRARMQAEP
jgi:hypothetical protein